MIDDTEAGGAPQTLPTLPRPRWRPAPAVLARGGMLAAILVAAVFPRLQSLPALYGRGEIMQWDGDSAYHLKRILYAIAHFPDLPRFDPEMNWPKGAPCPWPDGFDLLAAAWAWIAGLGSAERAVAAAMLFTPVLGLLVIWAAMDLARLVSPEGPAREGAVVATGILTAMVPSCVRLSQVGFLDHHIAELLAFLLLAGWALRRMPRRGEPPLGSWVRWEVGGALAATFATWVFAGGALYVAIAFAIVLAAVLSDERPTLLGSGAVGLAAAAIVTALLSVPALRAHGRVFTYQFPSMLPPLLVLGAAAALAIAVVVSRRVDGTGRRLAALSGIGFALALAGALLLPGAASEIRAGVAGWILRKDPWIASISEFQRFGFNEETFLLALFHNFGAVGVLAPLLLLAGGWAVVSGAGRRGVAFVLLSIGFVALTLHQVRFERIGQPLLMINAAAALAAFAHWRRSSDERAATRAVAVFPALVALVLGATDPSLRSALTMSARVHPIARAAVALRDLAAGDPRAAALTSWDHGHVVSVISGVPTPTNGFGSYLDADTFAAAQASLTTDGQTMDRLLGRLGLRFLVTGALSGAQYQVGGLRPFEGTEGSGREMLNLDYMRSYALSPLIIGGSAIPGAGVRHLEKLMPVYATPEAPTALAFPLPGLWIFERVAGARLVGRTAPATRVLATLPFREQGRPHVWKAFTDSDAKGRFELVLPFPTGMVRPGLSSAPRYALRAGDGPVHEAEVPETVVRAGGTIEAGTLTPAAGQGSRGAIGSRTVKVAPTGSPLATEISPPKDSAMP